MSDMSGLGLRGGMARTPPSLPPVTVQVHEATHLKFSFFMVHTEAASDEGGKFDVVCSAKKRKMRL